MSSKHLNGDFNYAWPTAEVAVMGAKGACEIIFKGMNTEVETALYEHAFANPLKAAERGFIEDIVIPEDTRKIILDNLKCLDDKYKPKKYKRHNNVPL